ncbi:uncharacterized protein LOC18446340 isoform X1 [Amborella trichopoda]|uniref:uncharacterized protein LOC18446340 isoform X1 n=2 Tax=Amborella trichopoda TaxID=13333 RepID=UPI0009C0C776|nr:uncharacterized protein LOC18446340 isoform X1 [Amborella trichopoda]|eukprot:XP_020530534.1 uncharacterized protein LOC18446340 isoform X1 [Amborella trichopoda]
MAEYSAETVEGLKALLSSSSEGDKARAYTGLFHLQKRSADDNHAIQILSQQSLQLLPLIKVDIFNTDEEIAAQALKCLGFLIYHPTLVAVVPDLVAQDIIESLEKLIMTTKMKAICNLAVWCISVQQFSSSFLASHQETLLKAVVYAIDNPFGSLSTTFEAIQGAVKLATQMGKTMRESSHVWAPCICRRLFSLNKRDRDMAERCLQKIKSIILPPPLRLSKAIALDIKHRFLSDMEKMLQLPLCKVHVIQAWGWLIRLLGSHVLRKRHLLNEMLKIPEKTFSCPDPQVQIASQVAWEALIDILLQQPVKANGTNVIHVPSSHEGLRPSHASSGNYDAERDVPLKRIKLLMTPLVGVLSSACDIPVRLASLNMWHYILHKLDVFVNHPSIQEVVLEPIFKAVFQMGPDDRNIFIWSRCLDLFDELVSSKIDKGFDAPKKQVVAYIWPPDSGSYEPCLSAKMSWHDHPIKWLPWDLNRLNFYLNMVQIIRRYCLGKGMADEYVKRGLDASLRIFKSLLQRVKIELKGTSRPFDEIVLIIHELLSFTKDIYATVTLEHPIISVTDWQCNVLQFIEVVIAELEHDVLKSPLYKVPLDIQEIQKLQCPQDTERANQNMSGSGFLVYMDLVSPMVYIIVLYFVVVAHSLSALEENQFIMNRLQKFSEMICSICEPLDELNHFIGMLYLYMQNDFRWGLFKMWRVLARGLNDRIDSVKYLHFLRSDSDNTGYAIVYYSLCCPLELYISLEKMNMKESSGYMNFHVSPSELSLELDLTLEVWRSLYYSANHVSNIEGSSINRFAEGMCRRLTELVSKRYIVSQSETQIRLKEELNGRCSFLFLIGELVIYVLKQTLVLNSQNLILKNRNQEESKKSDSSNIRNYLEFVARYLRLLLTIVNTLPEVELDVILRTFASMTIFVSHLCLKKDILLFMEIISDPLAQWLSLCSILNQETNRGDLQHQLSIFWTETLDCLRRSKPPLLFNSSLLTLQAPLLGIALNHPHSAISDATISFWQATYGKNTKISYPHYLFPILVNLKIVDANAPLACDNPAISADTKCVGVNVTQKGSSKRVVAPMQDCDALFVGPSKRKCSELTEHQMEVRRAQQGRVRDCMGHGP